MAPMTGIETRPRATLEDYMALPDDVRAELLAGELVLTPAPHTNHQTILLNLAVRFQTHVRSAGLGRVWMAPVGVHRPTGDVVEPDLVFLAADRISLNLGPHIEGAPDLLVEVLSPSGVVQDRIVKRDRYARSGVREYWIVDGDARSLDVYRLADGAFADPLIHKPGHVVTSWVLPKLQLPVDAIFEDLD